MSAGNIPAIANCWTPDLLRLVSTRSTPSRALARDIHACLYRRGPHWLLSRAGVEGRPYALPRGTLQLSDTRERVPLEAPLFYPRIGQSEAQGRGGGFCDTEGPPLVSPRHRPVPRADQVQAQRGRRRVAHPYAVSQLRSTNAGGGVASSQASRRGRGAPADRGGRSRDAMPDSSVSIQLKREPLHVGHRCFPKLRELWLSGGDGTTLVFGDLAEDSDSVGPKPYVRPKRTPPFPVLSRLHTAVAVMDYRRWSTDAPALVSLRVTMTAHGLRDSERASLEVATGERFPYELTQATEMLNTRSECNMASHTRAARGGPSSRAIPTPWRLLRGRVVRPRAVTRNGGACGIRALLHAARRRGSRLRCCPSAERGAWREASG